MRTSYNKNQQRTFLVNNADNSEKNEIPYTQARKYLLRGLVNEISEIERVQKCGNTPIGEVQLSLSKGRAFFRGLHTCNSVHVCTVCAPKILWHRVKEIEKMIEIHLEKGGSLLLLSLTVKHSAQDTLSSLLEALGEGWNRMVNTKTFSNERSHYGLKGWVKANEQVVGENGFHPHSHSLLFLENEISPAELTEWTAALSRRYLRGVSSKGVAMDEKIAVNLKPVEVRSGIANALAWYLCKQGFLNSSDGSPFPAGSSGDFEQTKGLTPFELVERISKQGSVEDVVLFQEYEKATLGKRQIQWSQGFRKSYGLDDELSEDEIMDLEEDEESFEVSFHPQTQNLITKSAWNKARLLIAYEEGGIEELLWFLGHLGVRYSLLTNEPNKPNQ